MKNLFRGEFELREALDCAFRKGKDARSFEIRASR
jgi:hypothetical protein